MGLILYSRSNFFCFHICIAHSYTSYHRGCKFLKCFFGNVIITHHYRYTLVAAFADALYQWYLTQERKIILICQSFASIFSKNVILIFGQFFRSEITHVFYKSQNRNVQLCLAKHGNSFFSISQRNVLRRCNNNGSCHLNSLHQSKMNIAGAGWHIYN